MEKQPKCDMCKFYPEHLGFVINANQKVPCWQCNPQKGGKK